MSEEISPIVDYWFGIDDETRGFELTPIRRKWKKKKEKKKKRVE